MMCATAAVTRMRSQERRPKVDEKAYKAALDRIPVPDEKYDPWGGARATDTKASKKKN